MKEEIILFFIVSVVVGIIIRLIMLVKCYGKKECGNKHCHFRLFCDRYQEITTQEDLDRLTEIIKKYADENDE